MLIFLFEFPFRLADAAAELFPVFAPYGAFGECRVAQ